MSSTSASSFIKRRSTVSATIELHALSAASGFQQFILHTATGLSQAEDASGDFTMADIDHDAVPDLVYIKRRNTSTPTIELHVLGG